METLPRLRYDQALLASLLDDTEDAPWMVVPEFQLQIVRLLMSILEQHILRLGLPWHVFSELWIIAPWPNDQGFLRAAPDLFVAEADPTYRRSWQVNREGSVPPFVLEVVTDESTTRDLEEKVIIYDQMGVREYAIFIPEEVGGELRLLGYRRADDGAFVQWEPDAQGRLESHVLGGLRLYAAPGSWLRLLDRDGHILPSEAEERDRQAARASHEAARAAQESVRANQETARADAAERELARLRALLATDLPPHE